MTDLDLIALLDSAKAEDKQVHYTIGETQTEVLYNGDKVMDIISSSDANIPFYFTKPNSTIKPYVGKVTDMLAFIIANLK